MGNPPRTPKKRVRLVSAQVLFNLVVDDGETLTTLELPPSTITAQEWPDFSGTTFPRDLAEYEKKLNEPEADK